MITLRLSVFEYVPKGTEEKINCNQSNSINTCINNQLNVLYAILEAGKLRVGVLP